MRAAGPGDDTNDAHTELRVTHVHDIASSWQPTIPAETKIHVRETKIQGGTKIANPSVQSYRSEMNSLSSTSRRVFFVVESSIIMRRCHVGLCDKTACPVM